MPAPRRLLVLGLGLGLPALVAALIALPALRPQGLLQPSRLSGRWSPASRSGGSHHDQRQPPLILLGDSITAAGPWRQAFPQRMVVNAGIPGDTSADLLARLDSLPPLAGSTVVLMAGINDILQDRPAAAVADRLLAVRRGLLERGAARVVVMATLPCEAARWGPRCLAAVAELNRCLLKPLPAADVLDLRPALSDAGGLRRAMGIDGLHLNEAAYRIWIQRLKAMV